MNQKQMQWSLWSLAAVLVFVAFIAVDASSKASMLVAELKEVKTKDNKLTHEHGQRVKGVMEDIAKLEKRLESIEAVFNVEAEVPASTVK